MKFIGRLRRYGVKMETLVMLLAERVVWVTGPHDLAGDLGASSEAAARLCPLNEHCSSLTNTDG